MPKETKSEASRPGLANVRKVRKSDGPASAGNGSPLDVFMLLDHNLNCVSINTAGRRLSDALEEDVLGKNILDISPDIKQSGRYRRYLDVIETGEPFIADYVVADSAFGEVCFSLKAFKAGNGLALVLSDLTERKEMEEALRDSEAGYRDIVENARDVIFKLSLDGTVTSVNPAYETMTGWSSDEWIGKNLVPLVHPDDLSAAMDVFQRLVRGEKPPCFELRLLSKRGEYLVAELVMAPEIRDGKAIGVLGIARDVTARKKAEEQLRVKDSAVASSINAIAMADLEGNISYVNPSFLKMWGYDSPDEVLGKQVIEFWRSGEQATATVRALSKKGGWRGELVASRKDGSTFDVQVSASIVKAENGQPVCMMASFMDITERRQAEEALRCSEAYFRSLIENALDGVVVLNEDGTLRYESPSMERILGYRPEERIGKNSFEVVHPEDLARVGEVFVRLLQNPGSTVHTEVRGRHRDGCWRTFEVVGRNLLDDPKVAGVVANFRDVTERKETERALRESEEKLRRLVEDMNDGYCVVEGSTVVFANARSARMFGYSQQEVIGKTVAELLPAEIVDELSRMRARRRHGGNAPEQYETTLVGKDGTTYPVELGTRVTEYEGKPALSVVIRDISERRRMEEALRQSEQNYRVLFESKLDGVFVVDAKTMKVVLANEIAARLYGFDSANDAIGMDPLDFVHPDDRERALKGMVEDMFEGDKRKIEEFRTITRDGREIWVSTVGIRMEYEGRLAGLVSIRDITERKKAEADKKRMEQQLQLTGRLAAVGQLAAGVAHELNNPLASVQAYAQFLVSEEDLDERVRNDLETIYGEAQRASRITANLLSFARRHRLEKRLISVNEVIEKSLELHAYSMRVNNIEVATELDAELPMTMADFCQMQQVFVNIITNAEQAMTESNGKGKLLVRTCRSGEMIRIAFIDDGPGIPEDNLTKVFDPFFTTKEVGKGTGLGLSICYGIVQEHGGHLYASSRPGEGTTFMVEVPIVSEDHSGAERMASIQGQEV